MNDEVGSEAEEQRIYAYIVAQQSPELFCDNCGFYPIEPVHGHFMCPECHMPTKCCEGMPANV